MTIDQIQKINSTKSAIYNKIYTDNLGNTYIGTKNKRLTKLIQNNELTSAISSKVTSVDFGRTLYQTSKYFRIFDVKASANRSVTCQIDYSAPSGKSQDEIEMDEFEITSSCRNGYIEIFIKSLSGSLHDKFNIKYTIL